MNGAIGRKLWERVVEPVRREQAKVLSGDARARANFPGYVEMLGKMRLGLVECVNREENGVLSEISSEFCAMEKLAQTVVRAGLGDGGGAS